MHKLLVGWMYPDLLNLHGERGSLQALMQVGQDLGIDIQICRIEKPSDTIPFDELDLLVFLPGEITTLTHLIPALLSQKDGLDAYLQKNGYLLSLGTTGLMFGKSITREDGTQIQGLGYLDMTATERKYVWGDDLHICLRRNKQALIGSQIMMADVTAKYPLADTIYGRGNNGTGTDGARWKNLIYTNCLGPLFVKNPWFAESILKDIILQKSADISPEKEYRIAQDSYAATLAFIKNKPKR